MGFFLPLLVICLLVGYGLRALAAPVDGVDTLTISDVGQQPAAAAKQEAYGELHTSGNFLHLLRHSTTGEYLAPTYETLLQQIIDAFKRHAFERRAEAEGWTADPSLQRNLALLSFSPYPPLPIPLRQFKSNVIAIIDSGILQDHPLLTGAVVDKVDFTGQGVEDQCGHGTIQAIRQLWFEPSAKLMIIKAFGENCQPTISTLLAALEYLRGKDVGYIFVAGGINVNEFPYAQRVCDEADALVKHNGLDWGSFVATTGNMGGRGKWCPAAAKSVQGVQVVDKDSYKAPSDTVLGQGILEKGYYVSFPDIKEMPLGQFYLTYANLLAHRQYYQLARSFGEKALDHKNVYVDAVRLLAALALQERDFDRASVLLTAALAQYPAHPKLQGYMAIVLMNANHNEEAGQYFQHSLAADPKDPVILYQFARFSEEKLHKPQQAFENFAKAAELSPLLLDKFLQFGGRAFYDENYDLAIAVNKRLLRLDPTLVSCYYNIAISHALKGELEQADQYLTLYAQYAQSLDSSSKRFDAAKVRDIVHLNDDLVRQTLLEYAYDDDRQFAMQYVFLRDLLAADKDHRRFMLTALTSTALADLCTSALKYAERLLLHPRSADHAALAEVLIELSSVMTPAAHGRLKALTVHMLGRLHHRLGHFDQAVASFDRAAQLWEPLHIGLKEEALVDKGYASIMMSDTAAAAASFEAGQTRAIIHRVPLDLDKVLRAYMTPNMAVITAGTPRIHTGLALLALLEGDFKKAQEELRKAFAGDRESVEPLLVHYALALKTNDITVANEALELILSQAYTTETSRSHFLRLLDDFPFYNATHTDGKTIRDYFHQLLQHMQAREVTLVSNTRFAMEKLFNHETGESRAIFGDCKPLHDPVSQTHVPANAVAVVGTGLLHGHPCFIGRIADAIDFTGEGLNDRNGSTTAQALAMLSSSSAKVQFYNVKILNKEGMGSVRAFIMGLLWSRSKGARTILTHVQTAISNPHLLGIVRRVSKSTLIVTSAPDDGKGTGFPLGVTEHVIIAH